MFLKTKVLDALSIAGAVATLVALFSIARLAETGVFPAIGFLAMVFVGAILLLHAVYFYGIRNESTRNTKLVKKMLSVVNVIGVFAITASFLFMTVAAAMDIFFAVLWVLVIVMLNLVFTTN